MSAPPTLPQQQHQAILAQAQGIGQASNPTQIVSTIIQNMPQFLQMAKDGHLNETQLSQLQNLARMYAQPNQQVQRPATTPANGSPQQNNAQRLPAPGQSVAGQKRKSPMPDSATPFNPAASAPTPVPIAAVATPTPNPLQIPNPVTPNLVVPNPGPQNWPNTAGPRPTLSQGLAAGSTLMGTPTHISRVPDSIDALGALNQAYKKDGTSAVHDPQMRRTVKDLVASIDPTVKIDKDVEDMILDMADEFIDSVINFSCRLAKHRGSDVLDVKDLQLHLERNHNIRIPGFASDETRLAISHSNPVTSGHPSKIPKTEASSSVVKKTEGEKEKPTKESKGAKGKAAKAKEVQGSAALRAARVTAVRAMK